MRVRQHTSVLRSTLAFQAMYPSNAVCALPHASSTKHATTTKPSKHSQRKQRNKSYEKITTPGIFITHLIVLPSFDDDDTLEEKLHKYADEDRAGWLLDGVRGPIGYNVDGRVACVEHNVVDA